VVLKLIIPKPYPPPPPRANCLFASRLTPSPRRNAVLVCLACSCARRQAVREAGYPFMAWVIFDLVHLLLNFPHCGAMDSVK